jgi:hypothetical protein
VNVTSRSRFGASAAIARPAATKRRRLAAIAAQDFTKGPMTNHPQRIDLP